VGEEPAVPPFIDTCGRRRSPLPPLRVELTALHHRFLRTDALQHCVGTDSVGQFLKCGHAVFTRSVTMSVAPNSRASFCANCDDSSQ